MGSTSVRDVGSLFGGLNVQAQDIMAGRLSNNIPTKTMGDSASFKDFLDTGKTSAEKEPAVAVKSSESKADTKPADKENDTSDRIAGEDKLPARRTEGTDEKQVEDEKTGDSETIPVQKTKGEGLDTKSGMFSDAELLAAVESLVQVATSFLEQVCEILEITPEEAQDILADMNLEETDLLDPGQLNAFALRAMGAEDSLSLLTNETHYEQFQDVNEALKTVLAADSGINGLNVYELKQVIDKNPVQNIDIPDKDTYAYAKPEPVMHDDIPEEAPTVIAENDENPVPVKTKAEALPVEEKRNVPDRKADMETESSDIRQLSTEEGNTLGAEALIKNSARGGENRGNERRGGGSENRNETMNFQNQFQNVLTRDIQAEAAFAESPMPQTVSTREIANQIMDYMRSQVKPDMQSLEMQLHPASLGTIQINLVHRDGSITANFIAQDEQVRAVLENQMIQLQERFEEQGIKVNSIEVSVGTGAFEQNLEQQGHQEEEQAANTPRRVRRLQLGPDFAAEDIEQLEGDDRIAAEMMAANGTTMDVQA
ncbi:MAG: flagellar hook-length control protein FliK [Lachnospiraceae bacterium]|nr:flagellar hook-length control protein FliK [Lachnospiraceae bacterium]